MYEQRVAGSDEAPAPPALPTGRYGFEASALDANDRVLASVCEERALPGDEPLELVLASDSKACVAIDGGAADAAGAPEPDAATDDTCGDSDQDGCDDCSYGARPDPARDGPEVDGDGRCDCVVFADASVVGAGDGARWSTAFSRVDLAVERAAERANELGQRCEVWVRRGTYHAYQSAVTDSVVMRRGVDLYGGFAGGELERGLRSDDAALTVLDGRSADSAAQRVQHVLTGADEATIEGFTIVAGDAAGTGAAGKGGGMLNVEVSPVLRNLRFRVNHAALGGGAIYNLRASVRIERCTFEGNTTDAAGGGILDESGELTLRRSEFRDNQADDARFGGAGLYALTTQAVVESCLFVRNLASGKGGAVLSEDSTTRLTNCTLSQNEASEGGGLMRIDGVQAGQLTIENSIVYGNQPDALSATTVGGFTVRYCDIEGSYLGIGNIDVDPKFSDAAGGDYSLALDSPCVDAADGDVAPAVDLEGQPRVDAAVPDTGGGTPSYADMGAYELLP